MTWHTGRLIDHIHLRARNFINTRFFYEKVLATLGLRIEQQGEGWFQVDELFVDGADAQTVPTHIHLAFQTKDRETVDAFYNAALAAGALTAASPVNGHTTPAITVPSCSIRMATISKPCSTDHPPARRRRLRLIRLSLRLRAPNLARE